MDDFESRRDTLFAAIAAEQRLPADAIAKQMERYPQTVLEFFVVAHDQGSQQGFEEAFRLIDLLQNLGCHDLRVPHPEMLGPVVIGGLDGDGGPFQFSMPRGALNFDRHDLLRLIKQRLGIERPTRQTAYVRPTPKSQPGAAIAVDAAPAPPVELAPRGSVRPGTRQIALSGKLHQMPIEDLVQIFQMQRKTGVLSITGVGARENLSGTVGFLDGNVVDARAGDVTGEQAFFALAMLQDGSFSFGEGAPAEHSIERQTASLLMEAARLKDESAR